MFTLSKLLCYRIALFSYAEPKEDVEWLIEGKFLVSKDFSYDDRSVAVMCDVVFKLRSCVIVSGCNGEEHFD